MSRIGVTVDVETTDPSWVAGIGGAITIFIVVIYVIKTVAPYVF